MQPHLFVRLAGHLAVLSRLVPAMSAWSVKTRRAPSRRCREARVNGRIYGYGHAWHEYTPTPPSPPPSPSLLYIGWVGLASIGNDTVKRAAHYLS